MVWGMPHPRSGGSYGPYGEFTGWNDSLTEYYLQQPPEIQKALYDSPHEPFKASLDYQFYVSGKFISEVGTRYNLHPEHPPFTPIQDAEAPQVYTIDKSYAELASLISLSSRILAVDGALKDIIERLQPSVHQFFPIEIVMPKDNRYPASYYTFVIGRYFDSLIPEKCKEGALRPNGPNRYFSDDSKKAITGRAFSKATFGGAHLWRERRLGEWLTCFSDVLQAEIESAGLLMPKHFKMIEV